MEKRCLQLLLLEIARLPWAGLEERSHAGTRVCVCGGGHTAGKRGRTKRRIARNPASLNTAAGWFACYAPSPSAPSPPPLSSGSGFLQRRRLIRCSYPTQQPRGRKSFRRDGHGLASLAVCVDRPGGGYRACSAAAIARERQGDRSRESRWHPPPSSPRRKRWLLGEAGVAPADGAARVTSRQEEPLRASAWPASPTNSGAQKRRGRERRPSGQVKARGQRGVAAAAHLRLCPELRSRRLSSRSRVNLRGGDRGAAGSGELPGRRAGPRRRRATWSCSLSVGGGQLSPARGRWQVGRAPSRLMAGLKVRREAGGAS